MGWRRTEITGNQVIVYGPSGAPVGVFVYQPGTTPAAGNPPIAWMTSSATDPFGNTLAAPVTVGTSVAGAAWNGMFQGSFYAAVAGQTISEAAQFSVSSSGQANLTSPLQTALDNFAIIRLLSRLQNGGTLAGIQLVGAVTATSGTAANPTVITTDAWTTLALQNGWAASGGNVRIRMMPDKTAWVLGQLDPAGMTSTTFATVVAPFVPSVGGDFAIAAHTATPPTQGLFTRAANTGVLSALNATIGSGIFGVNMRYPLD